MANKNKGELLLTFGGEPVIAKLSSNSLCSLETICGEEATEVIRKFTEALTQKKLPHRLTRAILWAMLLESRPNLTLQDAGALIDQAGIAYVAQQIMAIIPITWPDPSQGSSANPKRPEADGTGNSSTSSG